MSEGENNNNDDNDIVYLSGPKKPQKKGAKSSHSFEFNQLETNSAILIQSAYRRYKSIQVKNHRKKLFQKKTRVANEMLQTERGYISNLKVLDKIFLKKLLKMNDKDIGKDLKLQLATILSSIDVIVKYHVSVLTELQSKIRDAWKPSTIIGDVLLETSAFFKTYVSYVTHYQMVVQILAAKKNDSNFTSMLENLKLGVTKGKGIKDYLIMPVQRMPRYNMLVSDLIKSTWPDHRDYNTLVQAQKQLLSITEEIEHKSAAGAALQKKLEIASMVHFKKKKKNIKIASPTRKFIAESDVSITLVSINSFEETDCHLFAFNDLLLFCKLTKPHYYQVETFFTLDLETDFRIIEENGNEPKKIVINGAENEITIRDNEGIVDKIIIILDNFLEENNIQSSSNANSRKTVAIKNAQISSLSNNINPQASPKFKRLVRRLSMSTKTDKAQGDK